MAIQPVSCLWPSLCRLFWKSDFQNALVFPQVQGREHVALARPGNALSIAWFEQRSMGGALKELVVDVHKAARHPVKLNAHVGALVQVGSGRKAVEKYKARQGQGVSMLFSAGQREFKKLAGL